MKRFVFVSIFLLLLSCNRNSNTYQSRYSDRLPLISMDIVGCWKLEKFFDDTFTFDKLKYNESEIGRDIYYSFDEGNYCYIEENEFYRKGSYDFRNEGRREGEMKFIDAETYPIDSSIVRDKIKPRLWFYYFYSNSKCKVYEYTKDETGKDRFLMQMDLVVKDSVELFGAGLFRRVESGCDCKQ